MRHFTAKHIVIAAVAMAGMSTALLWSWNTLAALFGGPPAEFKHVLAALVFAAIARGLVTSQHPRRLRRRI